MRRRKRVVRPEDVPASKEYVRKKLEEYARKLEGLTPRQQEEAWDNLLLEAALAYREEMARRRRQRRPRRGEGERPVRLRR